MAWWNQRGGMKHSILIVDDEPNIRTVFTRFLSSVDFEVEGAYSLAEGRALLQTRSFDAAIIDQNLPDGKGIDLIDDLRRANPDMAIVVITGMADVPLAVEAMWRGADNFLIKPVNLESLNIFLRKSMEVGTLRRKVLSHQIIEKKNAPEFGASAAATAMQELALMAATNDSPVVITGETGVGKGMLAQWIHARSSRNSGVFVDVNCSSLRGELLASELFGHVKGAFTSAVQDRQGLLDLADNGTLFLDEIGDMDPAIQAQFLKVVEERSYRRLGETRTRRSDFRLICATNKDLAQEATEGRFRKDLLFRIQVVPMRIPALRERPDDIPGIVAHLLSSLSKRCETIEPEVMDTLQSYPWPGNIRELKNVLEYAVLRSSNGTLHPELFSHLHLQGSDEGTRTERSGELDKLVDESIRTALLRYDGDVAKAANALGISRSTVYRKMKKLH